VVAEVATAEPEDVLAVLEVLGVEVAVAELLANVAEVAAAEESVPVAEADVLAGGAAPDEGVGVGVIPEALAGIEVPALATLLPGVVEVPAAAEVPAGELAGLLTVLTVLPVLPAAVLTEVEAGAGLEVGNGVGAEQEKGLQGTKSPP
jgi:hypothetical protein